MTGWFAGWFADYPWSVRDPDGYRERTRAVYWHGASSCAADGPRHAACVLG